MQMTEKVSNMLIDNLNDLEEPFSPVMEQTSKSITGCLANVLQLASGADQANEISDDSQPSSQVK